MDRRVPQIEKAVIPRVVLDSNIWISAIAFGGKPAKIVELGLKKQLVLILSEAILDEICEVLIRKFPNYINQIEAIRKELPEYGEWLHPREVVTNISRDPADNRILECAAAGKANYAISGDKDLLVLKNFRGIPILTPAQFLKIFRNKR